MLRPRALTLPDEGWGHVDVTEADIDWDEPGEPKTGERQVPVPPELGPCSGGGSQSASWRQPTCCSALGTAAGQRPRTGTAA